MLNLQHLAVLGLCQFMIKDESKVLKSVELLVNNIDRHMARATDSLNELVQRGRLVLGLWPAYLHTMYAWPTQHVRNLELLEASMRSDCETTATSAMQEEVRALIQDFHDLQLRTKGVLEHAESTFQALMGTMSILESQKAINEAEEVTKLTQLAFFFIPLTFVAGIFGMNLGVS